MGVRDIDGVDAASVDGQRGGTANVVVRGDWYGIGIGMGWGRRWYVGWRCI